MIKRTCDRCGANIPIFHPLTNAYSVQDFYPAFNITVKPSSNNAFRTIDLCHECSILVYDVITGKDKVTENDRV